MQRMTPTPNAPTLTRPPSRLLQQFHLSQIGDDTIRTFLERGFSLAICCKECPRLVEWTPPELERRFGKTPGLRIADLGARLFCAGAAGGCGGKDVAVFPHRYSGTWTWSPATGTG